MSKRQRIFKGKLNPETPAKPKRVIRVLLGREVWKVSLIHPRHVPPDCGSNVNPKKRQIKLASGPGYNPFAALAVALTTIEELRQTEAKSRTSRARKRGVKA